MKHSKGSRVIVCSFSSSISELTRKEQRSYPKVLETLKASPRFSCFEASENMDIARTITALKELGYIEYPKPQPGYPWSKAKLTDKGEALLAAHNEAQDAIKNARYTGER